VHVDHCLLPLFFFLVKVRFHPNFRTTCLWPMMMSNLTNDDHDDDDDDGGGGDRLMPVNSWIDLIDERSPKIGAESRSGQSGI
jgi:hypothetical protein